MTKNRAISTSDRSLRYRKRPFGCEPGLGSDRAFPALVTRLLPVGLQGLVIAGLLAALMSSLSSVFNSCSTLITWDFYKKLKPDVSEQRLVIVGRIATGVLVALGLLWIPFMKYISSQLYIYLQSVQAYIAPPIAACFLLGLFIKRLNGAGAISSLITGFILGASRLVLELMNGTDKTGLTSGSLVEWITEMNFLHFAVVLFVICTGVLVGVSLLTKSPPAEKIKGLTFATVGLEEPGKRQKLNIILSASLVLTIGILWYIFA